MNPLEVLTDTVKRTGYNPETGFCAYTDSNYSFIGLVSEIGEVADVLKKISRNDGGIKTFDRQCQLIDEVADCLWYLESFAQSNGFTLARAIEVNRVKLNKRLVDNTINERVKS